MWELVVIWDNSDKDIYKYNTEQEAENAAQGMRKAFGTQIQWAGVRRARV